MPGKLLTVGHLFTRLEETGRPRPMHDRERAGFLRELDAELVKLPKADPWRTPHAAPAAPIPDSFLVGNEAIRLTVALADDRAQVHLRVAPKLHGAALHTAICDFMAAKYKLDRDHVTVR